MKIGMVSDLHIDINEKALNEGETVDLLLAQFIEDKQIEILLIAGDISNNYIKSQQFIEKLKKRSGIRVYFVPGNHDYWSKEHNVNLDNSYFCLNRGNTA
ncbi:Calcineurin-like phosphoesterase superfamily domain-containing protein [Marinilactibacillus piezotolerans]|uniref:Calcineurin-like phosphoesterase superfamily domain-containing protein n=1 Tax=Marinilactibacillus piezotolerans TaxID=258723 RepID=A0A1I4A9S0_9LACT|nr:metallophosphoesterase [Marinilactibacillus piezotolerans]SFK52721.1 Calcineurin-like phosphoesterase superfamily domain-containing protein [Marinilactibacillus piezotolerans]